MARKGIDKEMVKEKPSLWVVLDLPGDELDRLSEVMTQVPIGLPNAAEFFSPWQVVGGAMASVAAMETLPVVRNCSQIACSQEPAASALEPLVETTAITTTTSGRCDIVTTTKAVRREYGSPEPEPAYQQEDLLQRT